MCALEIFDSHVKIVTADDTIESIRGSIGDAEWLIITHGSSARIDLAPVQKLDEFRPRDRLLAVADRQPRMMTIHVDVIRNFKKRWNKKYDDEFAKSKAALIVGGKVMGVLSHQEFVKHRELFEIEGREILFIEPGDFIAAGGSYIEPGDLILGGRSLVDHNDSGHGGEPPTTGEDPDGPSRTQCGFRDGSNVCPAEHASLSGGEQRHLAAAKIGAPGQGRPNCPNPKGLQPHRFGEAGNG